MKQVEELCMNCNNPFQFAKTHSTYLTDWEKTKKEMEAKYKNGVLPPGISDHLQRQIIDSIDKVIQNKLALVRMMFESKFNESIYNYLGEDGKTKTLFNWFR